MNHARVERVPFLVGLALTTLATLALEVLDTRLLSVVTWYHLSFLVVSIGMFGMTAGAVEVYLHAERYDGEAAKGALVKHATWLALAIPASHVVNLVVPVPSTRPTELAFALPLVVALVALAVPFYLSGIVVAVALTRVHAGAIGLVYAVDLVGAAAGSLLVLPLLDHGSVTFGAVTLSAVAALGAAAFAVAAGAPARWPTGLAVVLAAAAAAIQVTHPILPAYTKGYPRADMPHVGGPRDTIETDYWTVHGHVAIGPLELGKEPGFWGPGLGWDGYKVDRREMLIDGDAGTWVTGWDGDPASLQWTRHDVTSLPYHVRPGGDVGVVGVGGGRDMLTALHRGATSVTGVEINRVFVDLQRGPFLDFARIASRPEVTLVHDEARSWLTRVHGRFDVLQMSLIDTWAATGAGAFTLSENGLYTVEAWDVFLGTLKPTGVFSVSRWYAPTSVSETSRLVSLATTALLRHGVADPSKNLLLVSRERIATLVVSPSPFTADDLARLEETCATYGFRILLAPGSPPADALLGRIVASRSADEVLAAVAAEPYDYTPPTDATPFFFNLTRPGTLIEGLTSLKGTSGVRSGNLMASYTLLLLIGTTFALVVLVVVGPLIARGLPDVSRRVLAPAVGYFGAIGAGFMLLQVGFAQRFSVYLGHPIYALSVILFTMILATGIGSALSDRIPAETSPRAAAVLGLATTAAIVAVALVVQPITEATIQQELLARCAIVVAIVAPVSLLLGTFFPLGMRRLAGTSEALQPWMWGVNGSLGVLAGCVAVAVSMWLGIDANLRLAALLYASTALTGTALQRSLAARAG